MNCIFNTLIAVVASAFMLTAVADCAVGQGSEQVPPSFSSVSVKAIGLKQEEICVNDRDEIWTVDLRDAHCSQSCTADTCCTQLKCGAWLERTLSDLIAAHQNDPSKTTILYLHGNRTNSDWAESRGVQTYSRLFAQCSDRPDVRMVVLKWRSEPELKRPVKDYIVKADRSVRLGPVLNQLLAHFGERQPIVMGYSLGAQIVIAALNTPMSEFNCPPESLRVVLIGPAIDCDFGACGTDWANSRVKRTLVFTNSKDLVVNYSKRLCRNEFGELYNVDCLLSGEGPVDLGQVSRFEISNELGKNHSIASYTKSPTLIRVVNQLIQR